MLYMMNNELKQKGQELIEFTKELTAKLEEQKRRIRDAREWVKGMPIPEMSPDELAEQLKKGGAQ